MLPPLLAGDAAAAMYDASESLRLTATLQASTSTAGSPASTYFTEAGFLGGRWQDCSHRLVSLALLGQLWDVLGSAANAFEAFYEGQLTVRTSCLY